MCFLCLGFRISWSPSHPELQNLKLRANHAEAPWKLRVGRGEARMASARLQGHDGRVNVFAGKVQGAVSGIDLMGLSNDV